MREGWREIRLGDVSRRRTDFISVVADDLYRIVGVQRSGWGLVDRAPARGDSMKFDKLMELHEDDLVYRTITAFEAPSTVVTSDFERSFVTPQTFPVYALDRSQILPRYMSLLTTWPTFHEEMSTRCVGTVLRRKTLSKGAFESIPIPLPPLIEQRRIVDLIASIDDAIKASVAEAREADSLTERLRAVPLPGDQIRLGSLLTSIDSGLSVATSNSETEGPKVLRISAIQRGRFKASEFKRVGDAALPSRAQVRDGDVLITRSNTPERVGFVGMAENVGDDCYMSDLIWRLVPSDQISPQYLVEVLSSEYGRAELMARASGTSSSMQKISKERIKNILIPSPLPEEQERFVVPIVAAKQTADAARATAEALRALRSNLLTVLLSGEHEIPESYDQFLNLDEEAAA